MVSKSIDVAMWGKKYPFSLACLTWIPRKNNIDMFMSDSTISGNCFVPVDDFKEKMPKKKLGKNFDAQVLKMGNCLVQCTNIHFNGKALDITVFLDC